jgi:hypothetical protein
MMAFSIAGLAWSGPRAVRESAHDDTIARVLGARAWTALPERARARFSRTRPAVYRGETDTRLTPAGRLFAWALLLFGAPLPITAGHSQAKVEVSVRNGGMSWTRHYRGPLGLTFRVRSIKRLSEDGRLLECCAGGWTMLLDLSVEDGVLVFRSCRFFWRAGAISVPVPLMLTPGRAEVRHTDLGEGRFRFTLAFDHPVLGRTIFQDGIFADPEDMMR